MKIIAIEEHFNTQKYVDFLHSRKEYPKRETTQVDGKEFVRDWWSPTNSSFVDVNQINKLLDLGSGRLREMDETGVNMQVLSLLGIQQFAPEEGSMIAKTVNDELYEITQKYPDRFAGFAAIAPQDPKAAALEIERAVKILHLKGAILCGHIHGEFLDNQKYWPIFEMAQKLDVPIYIHPFMLSSDMIKPYLGYPGLAAAMLGFSAQTSLHAMRLILSGVFDKYTNLKIILGHLGEALPFWLWRIDSRWLEEQNDPSASTYYKNLQKRPSQYFKDHFYVTTSGMFWEPVLQFTISVLSADRVLFATDYPFESMSKAAQFINSVTLSDFEKEKICHLNAEKLLKLPIT